MSNLLFPNANVLQLALENGLIPASVASSPAHVSRSDDGWLLCTEATLTRDVINGLRKTGVQSKSKKLETEPSESLLCWPQALSLQGGEIRGRALVRLPEPRRLPALIAELRRFGCTDVEWSIDSQTWLRVANPPPTMLMWNDPSCRYYIEQSPDVWVENGWRHPLAKPFQPPTGKTALLRPPCAWQLIDTIRCQKPVERFDIDITPTQSTPSGTPMRVPVRPRLRADREPGTAELWLVSESALLSWLARADDRLVSRLDCASIENNGITKVILWSRGKGPTVLVLDGDAYQSYLKLPNLYLPIGWKLTPPLRRDWAKRVLSPHSDQLAVLDADGSIMSVPVVAFRPLADCVKYELPNLRSLLPVTAEPTVTLDAYEVKDRPAGERIRMIDNEMGNGNQVLMVWDRDHWRLAARKSS